MEWRMRHGQGEAGSGRRVAPVAEAGQAHLAAKRERGPALRAAVAPFIAMEVLAEAHAIEAGGGHVVHMELGEPGAPAPRAVREAAKAAIERGLIGYTPALGLNPLRERIARHYADTYGVSV